MAVTENTPKNGTLNFIPNSHLSFINSTSSKKDEQSSEQFIINLSQKELQSSLHLNQKFGDLSLLHMNLKHKSGINSSNKFRITMGCRFHDMSRSFNSGKEIYQINTS